MVAHGRVRRSNAFPSRVAAFGAAASLIWMMFAAPAANADEIIEGQYRQNGPCRGDSSDPANLKVIITPKQISYSGGVCSIDSRRMDGQAVILQVVCKFRSGRSLGAEISLTPRQKNILHMSQQDGGFEADLYKCP